MEKSRTTEWPVVHGDGIAFDPDPFRKYSEAGRARIAALRARISEVTEQTRAARQRTAAADGVAIGRRDRAEDVA